VTNARVGLLLLTALSLFQAEKASAWTCIYPEGLAIEESKESALSEVEVLRMHSLWFADHLLTRRDGDVLVLGQFTKNASLPFLHEEQYQEIQKQYWPVSEKIQMPHQIEYTYLDAYRFEGHQIVEGQLVPFEVADIDAHVTISSNYSGTVDSLPPLESVVIGVLQSYRDGKRLELTTSICPTYHPIQPDQIADLLQCFADGACQ